MPDRLRAGIIGTGLIAGMHAHAIRAAGGNVSRVAGSSPDRAAEGARRLGAESFTDTTQDLVACDEVDIVHICTPNHLHARLAEEALRAGKHVVCEKPLATELTDARRLANASAESDHVAAVPFVYRYYPSVREARARIARNEAGQMWLVHGSYLQDWLSASGATNWRLDAAVGGRSRAFADIGVHWCDLMEFTTGHRIVRLLAKLLTAFPARRGQRAGPASGTEDGATVLFETDRGASGSLVLSQVSPGRKNRLWFSFDGTDASYAFDQELPDSLWVGGRIENKLVNRDPATLSAGAREYARLPAGHPQGYQDCFDSFVGDMHAAIRGDAPDMLPTFDDGCRAAVLTDAVLRSADDQTWVHVPSALTKEPK